MDDNNGNNNGKLDPGETADIIVALKNSGDLTAENIQAEINTASTYVTLVSNAAGFGPLAYRQTGNATFTVSMHANTPAGEAAEIYLDVFFYNGTFTKDFLMNFIISQMLAVAIDLDGNHNSAPEIEAAIETNGIPVEMLTSSPRNLDLYSSIFVCLGVYNFNHELSSSEGQLLADFLINGGNLYMEGGDTWYYDNLTAVHSMFNINGIADGSDDMNTVLGYEGTFSGEMSFNYSGDNN